MSRQEIVRLLHKVQVHQIELETQNEQLRTAQSELSESRDRYSDLYEFAPFGYLTLDRNGRIVSMNLQAAEMFGAHRDALLRRRLEECFAAESHDVWDRHRRKVLESEGFQTCTAVVKSSGTGDRVLRLRSSKAIGLIDHIQTAIIDITDLHAAQNSLQLLNEALEQRVDARTCELRGRTNQLAQHSCDLENAIAALADSESLFRAAFEDAALGMAIQNAEGRYLKANSTFQQMIGYTIDELRGKSYSDFTHPHDRFADRQFDEQLHAGRPRRYAAREKRYIRKDGESIWVLVSASIVWGDNGKPKFWIVHIQDISKRKRAEEALIERRSSLKEAKRIAKLGSWVHYPDSETGEWSDEMRRIMNWSGPVPSLREWVERYLPQEDHALFEAAMADAQEGKPFDFIRRAVLPDGAQKHFHVRGRPIIDDDGRMERIVGTTQDVTEQMEASAALRESQERLAFAVDGSTSGLWDWPDVWADEAWWSPRVYALLGFDDGEIEPRFSVIQSRIHPDDAKDAMNAIKAHLHHGHPYDVEYRIKTKSGRYRWFRSRGAARRDANGKATRMTGFIDDVDDRRTMQKALSEANEFNERVINTAQSIILVLDVNGCILQSNQYLKKLSGYWPDDLRGRDMFELLLRTEDRTAFRRWLTKTMERGTPTYGLSNRLVAKDGGDREIVWSSSALTNEQGQVVGVICTGLDVTERRKMERELLDVAKAEQERIGRDIHDGLCQELTGLGMLAEGISDELVTILKSNAENRTALESLLEASKRLSDGIGRTTGQARAWSHNLVPVDVDAQGLRSALRELATTTNERSPVCCTFDDKATITVADNTVATQLYRIGQEAVNNALRHSKAKQIEISFHEVPDGKAVLRVSDDGVGFCVGTEANEGMGLRTMNYRADLISAVLEIESKPDCGTTVSCTLPYKR